MKKFMKISAVTAAVLILLGLVLGFVGYAIAGSDTVEEVANSVTDGRVRVNLNPASDDFGIGILDNTIEGIAGGGLSGIDTNDYVDFDSRHEIYQGNVEKFRLEGEVQDLRIDAGNCEFICETSGDGNFYLEAESAEKLQGYVDEGVLYVKAAKRSRRKSGSPCRITLYVPEAFAFEDVRISLGAGTFSLGRLYAGDLEMELGAVQVAADCLSAQECSIRLGAGGLTVKELAAGDCLVEVGMGELVIEDMDVETLDAEVGMGNLGATGAIRQSADLECAMGDLDLTLEGEEGDFNYEIEAAMGSVTIGGRAYSGLASEHSINNDADKSIRLECSMGDLKITFLGR